MLAHQEHFSLSINKSMFAQTCSLGLHPLLVFLVIRDWITFIRFDSQKQPISFAAPRPEKSKGAFVPLHADYERLFSYCKKRITILHTKFRVVMRNGIVRAVNGRLGGFCACFLCASHFSHAIACSG